MNKIYTCKRCEHHGINHNLSLVGKRNCKSCDCKRFKLGYRTELIGTTDGKVFCISILLLLIGLCLIMNTFTPDQINHEFLTGVFLGFIALIYFGTEEWKFKNIRKEANYNV